MPKNHASPESDVEKIIRYYDVCHALLRSPNPISLPNYRTLTFKEAEEIAAHIKAGDRRRADILFMSHVMLNNNRATRLTYYYASCKPIQDLIRLLEAATLAAFQENYIAAYLTLMPAIEGAILRWSECDPRKGKPTFKAHNEFVAGKCHKIAEKLENASASDNLKAVAKLQLSYLDSMLKSHLFSSHLSRISDLNRHLALHMIEEPLFCNSLGTANLFVLFDNLVDAMHWDFDTYGSVWAEEFGDTRRDTRRLYNLFFESASKWPEPHFRFAQDLNFLNDDYYAQWFAKARLKT